MDENPLEWIHFLYIIITNPVFVKPYRFPDDDLGSLPVQLHGQGTG
jgi:hypothetical protein